jgi:hypothetical protein
VIDPTRRRFLQDLAMGLSLANLCFVGVWAQVFSMTSPQSYFFDASASDALAVLLDVTLLGFAFCAAIQVARRYGSQGVLTFGGWFLLLILLIPLNYARRHMGALSIGNLLARPVAQNWYSLSLVGVTLVGTVYVLARWGALVIRAATLLVLGFTAFVVLTFVRATWILATLHEGAIWADSPTTATYARPSSRRVVILVFDEMDQRLAFTKRDASLSLPEFDRLRSKAFRASNAFPPASTTELSMPSMISGRTVSSAAPVSSDELMLSFREGGERVGWSTQETLFSRSRELGVNSALAGWYHPYCRVLRASLTRCFWEPYPEYVLRGQRQPLLRSMRDDFLSIAPWSSRAEYIRRYRSIVDNAASMLRDSAIGLVFLHIPVPHPPPIYDRRTQAFTLTNYPHTGYFDNLALADRTLGEIRRTMEAAGTWEGATVLVTADHWFRDAPRIDGRTDHRVPFILKLGGVGDSMTYEERFNTVVIHDLVLSLLRGVIRTPKQVEDWLDQRPMSATDTMYSASREIR